MSINALYRENMLSHVKNPKNVGTIPGGVKISVVNTSCGDSVVLYFKIVNGVITDFKYKPDACAVSVASFSMASDMLIGKTVNELKNIKKSEILENFGYPLTPSREKCALLILEGLKKLNEKVKQ